MSKKIAMSVKDIIGRLSSVANNNLKIVRSAMPSFSSKFMSESDEEPNSAPRSEIQTCSLLNENYSFTNHSNIPPINCDSRENLNEKLTNQYKFNSFITPLNSTYAVSCSTMTTITTSVLTSSVMSSSSSLTPPNNFPPLSQYRLPSNFELHKNSPYVPSGNFANVQSSYNLPTFMTQNFHTSNQEFHSNKGEMSGFVAESSDNICNSKGVNEDMIMSDVVIPPLARNSDSISTASPSQFAPACFTLPPISIEKFDGNISDYMEFKIKVESLLAMSLYPDRLKVIYLKSYLCGEPLDSTSGIMPDDPGAYNDIWSILDEDYGMPDLVRDHHLSLLLSINSWPLCTTNVNLKKTLQTCFHSL